LLILDGERLSYRSLDVEQIGSVYEAIGRASSQWFTLQAPFIDRSNRSKNAGADPETTLRSGVPAPDPYSPTKDDKRRYTTGELAMRVRQSERSIEHAR